MYICPLCHSPLTLETNGYVCPHRHQFDRAKEGYVNLLPVQHKGSRDPGDSPQMLQSRRQFLEMQHYQPLRDSVLALLTHALKDVPSPTVLDLGCGEGYYTSVMPSTGAKVYGLDVSKHAVKLAAKRYSSINFCVASGYRLPFANDSLDAIVRIYAPSKAEELDRTLKSGGILLTVTPGARHLYQFKQMIYQEVQLHTEREHHLETFHQVEQQHLHYSLSLTGHTASLLLQMTPFAWRASTDVWEKLANSQVVDCEADFVMTLWRKK